MTSAVRDQTKVMEDCARMVAAHTKAVENQTKILQDMDKGQQKIVDAILKMKP